MTDSATVAKSGGAGRSRSALPDLVYPVLPVGECDELRYSLRSVATNADGLYRKVWIVVTDAATLPSWLTGVEIIEAGHPGGPKPDFRAKVEAACAHRGVAARFVLLNDDHFLVDPIEQWEAFHSGPTSAYLARLASLTPPMTVRNSAWVRAITSTAEWMAEQGYGDILARQGHRPLLWHKTKLGKALAEYPRDRVVDVLGLYDIAGAAGVGRMAGNAKVTSLPEAFHAKIAELDIPWLSSNDRGFAQGLIGGYIRGIFRTPSRYERD